MPQSSVSTVIDLATLQEEHLQMFEKILQLPLSQQEYLQQIVLGLGEGATKEQRQVAKQTVMTLLKLHPADVTFIRQLKQLSIPKQMDIQKMVQDFLSAEFEMEDEAFAGKRRLEEKEPKLANSKQTENSNDLIKERETSSLNEISFEKQKESQEQSSSIEKEISTNTTKKMTPTMESVEPNVEKLAISTAENNSQAEDNDTVETKQKMSESTTHDTQTQADHLQIEIKNSKLPIRFTQLRKGLVISSDAKIEHLANALEQQFGIKVRSVFGLYKSTEKDVLSKLTETKREHLQAQGLLVDHVRYPVVFEIEPT